MSWFTNVENRIQFEIKLAITVLLARICLRVKAKGMYSFDKTFIIQQHFLKSSVFVFAFCHSTCYARTPLKTKQAGYI